MLTGCTEIEAGAREFFKLGVQAAVITRGAKGCVVCTPKTTLTLNTYDTKVVDTTGSGDSFFGAFLTKLMETGKPVSEISRAARRGRFRKRRRLRLCDEKRRDSCARRPRIDRNVQSVYPAFKAVSHFPQNPLCTAAARSY